MRVMSLVIALYVCAAQCGCAAKPDGRPGAAMADESAQSPHVIYPFPYRECPEALAKVPPQRVAAMRELLDKLPPRILVLLFEYSQPLDEVPYLAGLPLIIRKYSDGALDGYRYLVLADVESGQVWLVVAGGYLGHVSWRGPFIIDAWETMMPE